MEHVPMEPSELTEQKSLELIEAFNQQLPHKIIGAVHVFLTEPKNKFSHPGVIIVPQLPDYLRSLTSTSMLINYGVSKWAYLSALGVEFGHDSDES